MRHLLLIGALATAAGADPGWQRLPSLPDREGFAGAYAGVSGDALLVAGGANFPDKKPWDGGSKAWSDAVYLLDRPDGSWRVVGKLPRPLGYGVSVTTPRGVLCIGGAGPERHHADCFLLRWDGKTLAIDKAPSLPRPCANLCGALVGDCVYVAGGSEAPNSTRCLKTLWRLDLKRAAARWEELPAWPGPARMLAVAAGHDGAFFLLSGTDLSADADGKPVRRYLRDAYRYDPGKGWRQLADLPRPTVAAPSPAPLVAGRLLIVSGDDGKNVAFQPRSAHPGFPRGALALDPRRDRCATLDAPPLSRATAPVALWRGRVIIPNGETRPGVRTPEVWALPLP